MSSNESLSELELKILLESRRKSVEEIARILGLDGGEVALLLENAVRKMPRPETLETPLLQILPRPVLRLEKRIGEQQIGTMKVGSQIVELLSKGIYSAPWNSLKELISNSFDADATMVDIRYLPEEKKLVVYDDGLGMDYVDFDEHFTFIVRSLKRERGLLTPLFRRPIIGKIGIGFIAVSELCDIIKVTSAKKDVDTYLEAEIDFGRMRAKEAKYKEFYEISQFTLTNHTKENIDEHYTKVELLELKEPFIDILENEVPPDSELYSIRAHSFEDMVREIPKNQIRDIKTEIGPYWEFLVNLATVIPVEYLDDGPHNLRKNIKIPKSLLGNYRKALRIIEKIKETLRNYNFKVFFDGMELRKPIFLPNETDVRKGKYGKDLCLFPLERSIEAIDPTTNQKSEVSYKGYFYYQRTRIIPQQLRGMMVRIKNVAIGGPILDFWGHPYTGDDIYFPQTFGEIYFDAGLEDAMNIDRSTFKTSHHEYAATRDNLHRFLRDVVFSMAKKMYYARRKERAETKEDRRLKTRTRAIKRTLGRNFKIRETRRFVRETVKIDESDKSVTLNVLSDRFQGFKKQDRLLVQDIALALEIAMLRARDLNETKRLFWRLLRQITEYRRL